MSKSDPNLSQPWWKEPYVWLVIGGPLIVVVAAIYTAVIAVRNPDPLVDRNASQQAGVSVTTEHTQQSGYDAALAKLQPAIQGRNHAAAPVVPKTATEK